MKKTYINPTMTVVKVKTRSLLTGASDPKVSISKEGSVNAASVESRRGGFWDDEEDEE